MSIFPPSTRLGARTDLRLNGPHIVIGEGVVIDDDVRIIVPEAGRLTIGDGAKIGKGSILNCGGALAIGAGVSLYGYCYVQTSRWTWEEGEKRHRYFRIEIGERATLAPFTTVCGDIAVPPGYASRPSEVIGQW